MRSVPAALRGICLAGGYCLLQFCAVCSGSMYCAGSFTPVFAPLDSSLASVPADSNELTALLVHRTIGWEMNNILFSSSDKSLNKFKNLEESTITLRAVLYDDALAAARIRSGHGADSAGTFGTRLAAYRRMHRPDSLLRISVHMESHFARQSLDPSLWTIYLVDGNGDMYEPDTIRTGEVTAERVERWERNRKYHRDCFRRDMDLYFRRITFYGQPVIGPERRFLKLVMASRRSVIGEGTWCFTGKGY